MSLLSRATARPLKALDQEAMALAPGGVYVPLENRQTWTDRLPTGPDAALNIATFYACVRVLAESVASLPMVLHRRLPEGGSERATDHELYRVFHDAPNSAMTSFTWRELIMSHLATWGDSFNEISKDAFGRLQLWPIRPDRMEVRWGTGQNAGRKMYYYLSPSGRRTELAPDTVFHITGLSSDGLRGYSPVELHRKTLSIHNAARDFGESTFRNGARPAVIMTHPKTLSDGAVQRLAGQMDELRGSRNAGKTVILEEGLSVTEVGVPPKDAQYIETRVFEAREIQKMFRMPPHMVGDLERATFSNIEHQGIEFKVLTLDPWLVRIEQEIKLQLLFDQPDLHVELVTDGLLRGDSKARAEALAVRWQHGNLSPNEWRALENENPVEGGDAYYVPVNYAEVGVNAAPTIVRETITETNPSSPPKLTVVKSAGEIVEPRCPQGHKIGERITPPTTLRCRHCKTTYTFEAPAGPVKTVEELDDEDMSIGLKATLQALAESVPAPIVNVADDTFVEAVADLHDSFVGAVADLKDMLAAPRRKTVLRDANGRITGVLEE